MWQNRDNSTAGQLVMEMHKGLVAWYRFDAGKKILLIGKDEELSEAFQEVFWGMGLSVDAVGVDEALYISSSAVYDYAFLPGVLELCENAAGFLKKIKELLVPDGKLLIAADNRLGIRYFCGDRDPFTGRNFDGIENYSKTVGMGKCAINGRNYAKAELVRMLQSAGFKDCRFYSVFPCIERPQLIYAEDTSPNEELENRVMPEYNFPGSVFLEEQGIYTTLVENGLFHTMANGFFIECPLDGGYSKVKHATLSLSRGKKYAMCTTITEDGRVQKKAVYEEGQESLGNLVRNMEALKSRGIHVLDIHVDVDAAVTPYVQAETATAYFRRLLRQDKEKFLSELNRFRDLILKSSEYISYGEVDWEHFEPGWEKRKEDDPNRFKWKDAALAGGEIFGKILRHGYIDMVSINCFFIDGEFVFFDQEYCLENIPADAVFIRTIYFIYAGEADLEKILPVKELMQKYGILEHKDLLLSFSETFLKKLRNEDTLMPYYRKKRTNIWELHANRQRVNYPEHEFDKLFKNVLADTAGKDVFLFGSGAYAKRFISRFGENCHVAGIFDNSPGRQGLLLNGISIFSPDEIKCLAKGTYKIIICMRDYVPALRQLESYGVNDIGVFDPEMTMPELQEQPSATISKQDEDCTPKKYHKGYVAGVFDVFHVGHLNLLRRAKEQCDYLVVGVVNDESVLKDKKTASVIPFEDRIDIVRSCRYVDEAVEIPYGYGDTMEMYHRYRFDVQFSGSDYENDPSWLSAKVFLEQHGAELVFFPYTEKTSSTKIKKQLRKEDSK